METLPHYHIFYTVAKTGNISKAADELFMSQPAISKSIKKLEDLLKTTLFIRSSRGVTLTEDGRILFEHIDAALSQIQEGEWELRRNRELGVGHIRIGVSTTLCRHIMLPLLETFILENPHIRITIDCLSSEETSLRLADNKLDAGLVVQTEASRTLEFSPLTELSYTFVAAKQYLDNLKLREGVDYRTDNAAFFRSANLMLMEPNNISRQHIENYFQRNGIETGRILETSNMELLVEFAKIGLGVACVIQNLVEKDIKNGTLLEIPLRRKISRRTVGFAYSSRAGTNPAVEKLKETSTTYLKTHKSYTRFPEFPEI